MIINISGVLKDYAVTRLDNKSFIDAYKVNGEYINALLVDFEGSLILLELRDKMTDIYPMEFLDIERVPTQHKMFFVPLKDDKGLSHPFYVRPLDNMAIYTVFSSQPLKEILDNYEAQKTNRHPTEP